MSKISKKNEIKCKKVKPEKFDGEAAKKLWAAGAFILGLSILIQFFFDIPKKHHFFWETIPFFYVIFGFASCALIIFLSKFLGFFLKRPLDYYEDK